MDYRADVDGLRALAVGVVVAYHAGVPGFDGGFVGVDVFFVISGYLITALLWKELRGTGRISWAAFYARRARRLLPALAVVTLATLAFGAVVMVPDPELRWLSQSVIAVAASLSNVFFDAKTTGYFGADADLLPLLNTWSLAVEEQFYLVWPPFLAAAWWAVRRHRDRGRRWVVLAVVAVAVGSFVLSVVLVPTDQSAAFYWMPPRLWELAAGGLLALGVARLPRTSVRVAGVIAAVGAAAVVGSVVLLDATTPFPGIGALPVVGGTVLVIVAGVLHPRNPVSAAFALGPLVAIGRLSYSWYLIHWPMLVFARLVWLEEDLGRDVLIAVVSLGLAAVSYRFVEQPVRTGAIPVLRAPRGALLGGAAVLVALALVGGVVLLRVDDVSRVRLSESAAEALRQNRTAPEACPSRPTGDREAVDCRLGDGRGPVLALVGDSHALALLPAVQAAADGLGWRLEVLWDVGCPFVVGYRPPAGIDGLPAECVAENEVRDRYLLDHADQLGAVVITGRVTTHVLQEAPERTDAAARAWTSAVSGTVEALTGRGVPVLVVSDVPRFEHPVPQCSARRSDCDVDRGQAEAHRAPVALAEARAVDDLALAHRWDPFAALCDEDRCWAQVDGVVLYRDVDHLSIAGAERLAPAFDAELRGFLERVDAQGGGRRRG